MHASYVKGSALINQIMKLSTTEKCENICVLYMAGKC